MSLLSRKTERLEEGGCGGTVEDPGKGESRLTRQGTRTVGHAGHQRTQCGTAPRRAAHFRARSRAIAVSGADRRGERAQATRPRKRLSARDRPARPARGGGGIPSAEGPRRGPARGRAGRPRLQGTPVPAATRLLRRTARAVSGVGLVRAAGPHRRADRERHPHDVRGELARHPAARGRNLPRRPGPAAHPRPELSRQSGRRQLCRARTGGAGRGRPALRGDSALRRDLRTTASPGHARVGHALLSRRHDHQFRPVQMVRGRRLAAGHVHLSAGALLADVGHGRGCQRDLYRGERADPVCRGPGVPGRHYDRAVSGARAADLVRLGRPVPPDAPRRRRPRPRAGRRLLPLSRLCAVRRAAGGARHCGQRHLV